MAASRRIVLLAFPDAQECGFGTVETLRRAFRRRLGVSPREYRERFRAAA